MPRYVCLYYVSIYVPTPGTCNPTRLRPHGKYLDMHISPAAERVRERCFWKLPASCHPTLSISALHLGRALLKDCKIALTPITLRQYSRPLHPESYGTSTRGRLPISRALPPSQPTSPPPTAPLQRQSYDLRAGHKHEKKYVMLLIARLPSCHKPEIRHISCS